MAVGLSRLGIGNSGGGSRPEFGGVNGNRPDESVGVVVGAGGVVWSWLLLPPLGAGAVAGVEAEPLAPGLPGGSIVMTGPIALGP